MQLQNAGINRAIRLTKNLGAAMPVLTWAITNPDRTKNNGKPKKKGLRRIAKKKEEKRFISLTTWGNEEG